jgi:hypothetical protein
LGHSTEVLTALCEDATAFELKRVKPTFRRRKFGAGNFDFSADPLFGFRNSIDATKLKDATSVLPAKKLDFRTASGVLCSQN